MDLVTGFVDYWLVADEWIGAALGLAVVGCLIYEKVWAWPLGVAYVLVSITVLYDAQLYANLVLHLVGFLPLNLYGWYNWLFGGEVRDDLPVTRARVLTLVVLAFLCAAGALGFGWYLTAQTDAAFAYWDSGILFMSLGAMWLTARKEIENWMIWIVVNVVSVGVYHAQGILPYVVLYAVYIPMCAWGYWTWLRSMGRRLQ